MRCFTTTSFFLKSLNEFLHHDVVLFEIFKRVSLPLRRGAIATNVGARYGLMPGTDPIT